MKHRAAFFIFFAFVLFPVLKTFAAPPNSPVRGAIFTTDATGNPVNQNLYENKQDVYLNGGPRGGAPEMPDGFYFIQVTDPSGNILGKAVTNPQPIHILNGSFEKLYQVFEVVMTASSNFQTKGYDSTTNPGGEYKVWVCNNADFNPAGCKADNFKVRDEEVAEIPSQPEEVGVEPPFPSSGEPRVIISSPTGETVTPKPTSSGTVVKALPTEKATDATSGTKTNTPSFRVLDAAPIFTPDLKR